MTIQSIDPILHPVFNNNFYVTYSDRGVKFDTLTQQTVSATYDFATKKLECKIELDAGGMIEKALIAMFDFNSNPKPMISINHTHPNRSTNRLMYSLVCNVDKIVSCDVVNSYEFKKTGVATVNLVCDVETFEVIGD
jgi:hypothetical protein